nr:MAG TPA: hypothetical protein [Caudoviricetes sp.]
MTKDKNMIEYNYLLGKYYAEVITFCTLNMKIKMSKNYLMI